MPRGGKRAGAGRPRGSATKKTRQVADAAAEAGNSPLSYMLSVLADPQATQPRKDTMAMASAPYCHPRLNAVAAINPANAAGRIGTVNIYAVPVGAQINRDGTITFADGAVGEPPRLEAYTPSPWVALPAPTIEPEVEVEPLEVIEPGPDDGDKIQRLDSWRRRGDDDPAA